MNLPASLSLLAAVALLTPIAAMFGLYDTNVEQLASFAAPAIGALTAIAAMRWFARRGR